MTCAIPRDDVPQVGTIATHESTHELAMNPLTNTQRTSSQGIDERDLERISARIATTPAPIQPLTKRGTIAKLRPVLQEALAAGHTPTSLASTLRQEGLVIAPRTLTAWLNIAGKPKSIKKSRSATKRRITLSTSSAGSGKEPESNSVAVHTATFPAEYSIATWPEVA